MCLLKEVEKKRTDLLLVHQKIQKRSAKLRVTKKMQKINEDMEMMRARFQALSGKSGENRNFASWRGKARKLCVAVKRMLL